MTLPKLSPPFGERRIGGSEGSRTPVLLSYTTLCHKDRVFIHDREKKSTNILVQKIGRFKRPIYVVVF